MLVGAFAGIAFLTGLTIIGTQVADEIRGRVNAFVQTIVRLTLLGALSLVPVIVGLVATRTIGPVTIDGTRVVMFAGGLVAAAVGSIAYRQMDDRRTAPMLPDLLAALRRGEPRAGTGLLVAVEGIGAEEAAEQAARLATWLRAAGHTVVALEGGAADRERWAAALREASLSGPRARALAAAAILADEVERVVRPALAAGALVVADRFLAVPLAQFGVATDGLDPRELEDLAVWATGRLRPDVSVLLDRAPTGEATPAVGLPGEEHVRVQRLLTHMAAAEPHRYVVVDADGPADEVAERVLVGLAPLVPPIATDAATVPTSLGGRFDPAPVGAAAPGFSGSSADTGPIGRVDTEVTSAIRPGEAPAGSAQSAINTGFDLAPPHASDPRAARGAASPPSPSPRPDRPLAARGAEAPSSSRPDRPQPTCRDEPPPVQPPTALHDDGKAP
jgi:dTMP kinase